MPGCPTIHLTGVSPQVWERLKGEARRIGVPVPTADSGSATAQGAHAEYRWDAAAQTLDVTFTELPQWIDCASVERRLREAVRASGGS